MALGLGLPAPAACALARFSLRGTNLVLLGILITQMVPSIVVADALYSACTDLGLLNSRLGLILADSTAGTPFAITLLHSFTGTIPGLPASCHRRRHRRSHQVRGGPFPARPLI